MKAYETDLAINPTRWRRVEMKLVSSNSREDLIYGVRGGVMQPNDCSTTRRREWIWTRRTAQLCEE